MGKFKDLTGMKFGRLTVIGRAENRNTRVHWNCTCDCGNTCVVGARELAEGETRSCGCLKKEILVKRNKQNSTHRMSNTKIFSVWRGMKKRCFNTNQNQYPNYGGRGITVYPAWIDDFQAFYDYVSKLEHFGEEGYTLDRIDNNGNYEPNNLRWTTQKNQCRNTRRNHLVEYQGILMPISAAAELSGIRKDTLLGRINRGDTGERLFRPVKSR